MIPKQISNKITTDNDDVEIVEGELIDEKRGDIRENSNRIQSKITNKIEILASVTTAAISFFKILKFFSAGMGKELPEKRRRRKRKR